MSTPKKNPFPSPPATAKKQRQTKLEFAPTKTTKQSTKQSKPVKQEKQEKQEVILIDDETWKRQFGDDVVQRVERLIGGLASDSSELEQTLKSFDMATKFGPQANMPRMERFKRAQDLGLSPPVDVHAILCGLDGIKDPAKREQFNIDYLLLSTWSGPQF